MDNALLLKTYFDNGKELTNEMIDSLLSSSELIRSLTSEFSKNSLYPIWRLLALSEIPYAGRLKYTQNLMEYIEKAYTTPEGFSITGKSADLLPCYNAMLIEAYSKLGYTDLPYVKCAVEWIKNYQVFGRNEKRFGLEKGLKNMADVCKQLPVISG